MALLYFGMHQSLDGFVDHDEFRPGQVLFRHFIELTRGLAGSLYGRIRYEVMSYWDVDRPEWGVAEHEFASAWRSMPKWVVSDTLDSVGPNAELYRRSELARMARDLKNRLAGTIEVGGTQLARALAELGLIDEYRIYLHPVALGSGTPFFNGFRPQLKFAGSELIDSQVVKLTYLPSVD